MIVVFISLMLSILFMSPRFYSWSIHEGDIALKDVYAPYDFTYFWEKDEAETEKARLFAQKEVAYVLVRDSGKEKKTIEDVSRSLEKMPFDKALKGDLQLSVLTGKTVNAVKKVFTKGYIDDTDLEYIRKQEAVSVSIPDESDLTRTLVKTSDLLTKQTLESVLRDYILEEVPADRKLRQNISAVVLENISPNLIISEEKTEEDRTKAADKTPVVYRKWTVKKNELVVEKGKRVNAKDIAQLSQLRSFFRPGTTPTFLLGVLLLFIILGAMTAIHTYFTRRINFLDDTKTAVMMLLSMFLIMVIADIVVRSPQPSYFIPMASMGMMLALLAGFNTAFLFVVIMSMFISMVVGGGINLAFVLMAGSIVGMSVIQGARLRSSILWAGFMAGVAKFLAIGCIGLINGMNTDFYIRDGVWGIASGLLSGFMVMGLLPVFEHLFKMSTSISLLELSDLNHPLLKKLAMEAPGTYHHSIMVGNLAEAASSAIGADSLRARVGAYYHDIGKSPKAEYFNENEMGTGSRHSNLAPSMSALIISKHVTSGIEMARKYKLNNSMIDFIAQHHGDSLISFFYQKAIEKAESGAVLDESSFRYPGPKPQTKECAIVLLADAVEAASRAMEDPVPSSIKNLVKKIINNKFIDGQLDECDLTLTDIHKIADSFVRVLMGIFHTRLDYPEKENKVSKADLTEDDSKQRKFKQKKKDQP
jgi:hypothetical protein